MAVPSSTEHPTAAAALQPDVSVLMPVYNTAPYLPAAVSSILSQTFARFELIAIDDGSTDESRSILEAFAAKEPRMRVLSHENRGASFTRNELLNEASADLIAWMDSDDVSTPDRLELQVAEFRRNSELVCLGSACLIVDPDGLPLHAEPFPLLDVDIRAAQWLGGGMRFGTSMMRTADARAVGGFRKPFQIGEDLDFLMRLAERGALRNLDRVLLHYRRHSRSASARLVLDWAAHRDKILELARERRSTGRDSLDQHGDFTIRSAAPAPLAEHELHVHWARAALAGGYRASARKHALKALRLAPWSLVAWRTLARVLFRRVRITHPTAAVGLSQMGAAVECLNHVATAVPMF